MTDFERFARRCDALIDAFFGILAGIAKGDPAHLLVVDSRGALGADDWANELHPKAGGFKKIALNRWQPLLQKAGLAQASHH